LPLIIDVEKTDKSKNLKFENFAMTLKILHRLAGANRRSM